MSSKTLYMAEIREALAKEDAESQFDYADMVEIFLNGCPGYNSYENDDALDYYLQRHYPDMNVDDGNPVVVLQVLDDGNGQPIAEVIQHQNDVQVEWK
jgi:hypothetical protein